jgi:hypothetical protein
MKSTNQMVTGTKPLSTKELALLNEFKDLGAQLEAKIEEIEQLADADKRLIAVGRTELQKGAMAITKAVERPATFF